MTMNDMTPINAERNPVVFESDGEVFTTSRDLASSFEKRHDNVLRDIDLLIAHSSDLRDRHFVEFLSPHPTVIGRMDRSFNMTRDGFTLLAMGFTGQKALKWKLRYIDAFNNMEAELARQGAMASFNIPTSLSDALRLAADQAETIEQQTALITDMTPKAEFHDDVSKAVNAQTFMQVAKFLKTGRNRFTKWLRDSKILMENNMPYQRFLDEGYFRVVEKKRKDPITGEMVLYTQTLVTGKGVTYLQKKMTVETRAAA